MNTYEPDGDPARFDSRLASPEFMADPYPLYHQLRAEDPVYWSNHWGGWLLTRYDDVVATHRNSRLFSNVGRVAGFMEQLPEQVRKEMGAFADHFSTGLIHSDAPVHTRLRLLVGKAFTRDVVERLRPHVQALVETLLDRVQASGRMDAISDFAYPLPIGVIARLLGIPPEDQARFKHWADDVTEFLGSGRAPPERALGVQQSLLALREYLRELFAQRRRRPEDDLLSRLVAAEEQGEILSEAELLATTVQLLIGGYETTTSLLGNGLLALLRSPDQIDELRRDAGLISTAVEELLRYDSPVQRQWRVALDDAELGGKQINKGQLVGMILGAANRDPAQFPDPDRLDIRRQKNRHVGFGAGIHFCLGAPLARLEAQIAFPTMLLRLPELRLALEGPTWRNNVVIRGLKALPVVF